MSLSLPTIPNQNCLAKKSLQLPRVIGFIATFALFWSFYNAHKMLGVYLAATTIVLTCLFPLFLGYTPPIIIKLLLVIGSTLTLVVGINYPDAEAFANEWLTDFLRMNILFLTFTINQTWLIILLLLATITTPQIYIHESSVYLRGFVIPTDVWVLFSSSVLMMYYLYNPYFCHNIYYVIVALLVPCVLHFATNQFIESRALILTLLALFYATNKFRKSREDFKRDLSF